VQPVPLCRKVRGLRVNRWPAYAGLGLVGAALAALVAFGPAGCGRGEPSAQAMDAAMPMGPSSSGDVVVAATPMGESNVVICLVDTRRQRLAVYQADARRSRLKLLAVRDISADWMLTDYNNDPPLPRDIRSHVEKLIRPAGPEPPAEKGGAPEAGP